MKLRCSTHRLLRGVRKGAVSIAGLFALALVTAFTAPALAAPVLDGNIDDVIAQANTYIQNGTGCGVIIDDPAKDVCLTDPTIMPCTNNLSTCAFGQTYFLNGFDQILSVAAVQGTDAWWGIRTNGGQIGDTDGDGTDAKGACADGPQDPPGIGPGEGYEWDIDTNCDGLTDFIITAQGGTSHHPLVQVLDGAGNPVPGVSGVAQYGTTDLEVHTTGLVLPPVFEMTSLVSSQRDGLSEDGSIPKRCNVATVTLAIQKSVDKSAICAGDKDRFTVSVTNPSTVAVPTTVRDVLPAGWTYANNVSGDFAFSSQNGQVVTFGPLSIPAGATRTVSFDATSPGDCLGPYENKAVAEGTLSFPCVPAPLTALTDTARATVTCSAKPCVDQVSCSTSATSLQDGSSLKLTGSAHNCSTGPEQMVFTLLGPGDVVLASRAFNVAAGATQTYDTTFIFHCTGTETKIYKASVVATNNCGTSTPVSSGDGCPVTCKSQPPCVNNVHCTAPAQACDGDQITISGFATNCSADVEQVVITLTGPGGTIGSHAFNPSAAGVAQFDTTVVVHCTGGQQLQFNASAVGTNQSGSTQPVSGTGCSIVCKQPPCVNNVHCSVPASACDGSSIKISGFATNCCVSTEEIVITLSGPGGVIGSHAFNVAAGAVAQFDTTITIHCTSGASVSYTASAVAHNDCGATQPVASVDPCTVQCKQPPCVTNVRCAVPATACDGSRIKLSGFAANCCAGTEEIIITLSGPDGTIGSHAFNVSAAGVAQFDTTITLHCTSGSSTTFNASAVARNECATTAPVTSDGCSVLCGTPPCVDQVSCSTSAASLCDGQPLTLTGTAHNCSTSPEEIVITLLGPSNEALASRAFNVEAGASVSYDTTITFHCSLGAGDAKMYNLAVVARNACGATNTVTCTGCSVKCGPGPCVDQVFCNTNPSVLQDGGQLKLTGHARNCGDHTEEFVIKLLAPGHVVIASRAFNVPAGGEVTYDTTLTFHCSGTETKTYNLEVTPRDACGTGATVTCLGCTVTCSGGSSGGSRCVTVRCDAPSSAADGNQIQVSGIAHNCSDHAEDILVCIFKSSSGGDDGGGDDGRTRSLDGGSGGGLVGCHWFRGVPAGADARFDTTVTFHCQSGGDDGGGDDGRTRSLDGGSSGSGTVYSATAQVFDASGAGSIVYSQSKCPVTCQGGSSGAGSCPRNICFWLNQCGSGGDDGGGDDGRTRSLDGGSGSLTKSQVTAIAGCIDSHSDFFNWSDDLQGFCYAINAKPADCKKQAIREFATLLANACIGQLGITDATGARIHLDLSAPNPCHSTFPGAATIGDLISAMDNLLVQLQNNGTDSQSSEWCKVSDCAKQINEGQGIALDCRSGEHDGPSRTHIAGTHPRDGGDGSGDEGECSGSGGGGDGDEGLQLEHPTPNPFSNSTGFVYKVAGTTSQRVEIGIYNVAGRLMRQLVSGDKSPGQYSTVWDGRDQGGSLVARGVYFIRGYVNGVRMNGANRVLYLK